MWIFVFCMLFNGGTVPWYVTMKNYGLMDSIWGLVLGMGLQVFNVILAVNFFKNLLYVCLERIAALSRTQHHSLEELIPVLNDREEGDRRNHRLCQRNVDGKQIPPWSAAVYRAAIRSRHTYSRW